MTSGILPYLMGLLAAVVLAVGALAKAKASGKAEQRAADVQEGVKDVAKANAERKVVAGLDPSAVDSELRKFQSK